MSKKLVFILILFTLFVFPVRAIEDEDDNDARIIAPTPVVLPHNYSPAVVVSDDQIVVAQIQAIISQQNAVQSQITTALLDLKTQNEHLQEIFGPNPQALATLKSLNSETQSRLTELRLLSDKLVVPANQQQLANIIQVLDRQHTEVSFQIAQAEKAPALLGWFFIWLNQK